MSADRTPKDQAARDRIVRDLDTSFAVEAGAGTGKTTLLTGRLLEALRTGRARLGDIVAITFTERAANELKVRLRETLESEAAGAEGPEAERLTQALAELDTAHVSTIHAFAADLLRERPVEAGVDPGFEVADAIRDSLLFDETWGRWLREQLARPDGPLRAAFLAGLSAEQLRPFARFLSENADLEPAGPPPELASRLDARVREFVPAVRSCQKNEWAGCTRPRCTCAVRASAAVLAADRLEAARPDEVAAVVCALPTLTVTRPQHPCVDRNRRNACKAALARLDERIGDLREPAGHAVLLALTRVLRDMVRAYADAKRQRGRLAFHDLLVRARDLLRDRRDVRRHFQRRFKMILVDECQDTDPLQTEIVLFLAEDGAKADDWRRVRVAPGKLLFVGDPKQSIYRFRRADIETYEEAKAVVARSGEVLRITENFRSARSCIDWVNAVFAELIRRPDDGAYQPEYVPLEAHRQDHGAKVTVLGPEGEAAYENVDAARAAECAAVAHEIRRMVGDGDTVLDKAAGQARPVRFADVALLFRGRTAMAEYENALSAAEVPYRALSGKDFFRRQEVTELQAVLAAIERAYDPLAVVAALRTSLLGVSDDELAAAAGDGFDYLATDGSAGGEHLRGVFRLLADRHRGRNRVRPSRLVQAVLSETKALELFYLKPGGEQRAANLSKVVDAARAYEEAPGATFGGFVRWLEETSVAGGEAESPLGEEGDFVTLLTIHQAKGLEFPVVVLADPDLTRRTAKPRPMVDRLGGTFDARLGNQGSRVRTAGFEAAEEREARRNDAETRRLLYVAATRARDRLVVPTFGSGRPGSHLECLKDLPEGAAAAAGAVTVDVAASAPAAVPGARRAFRVSVPKRPPKGTAKLRREREQWAQERQRLLGTASAPPKLATASGLAVSGPLPRRAEPGEDPAAAALGTAVHAVLERVDLATGEGLPELADEEAAKRGVPGRRDEVESLARAALGHERVQRAASAARLYREVPFTVKPGETLLEGVVDLAFDDGSGLHVVDYKTDDVPAAELDAYAERHRLQVGAYALAVREVFGAPPASVSLLFLRPGRAVRVPVDEALLEDTRRAL